MPATVLNNVTVVVNGADLSGVCNEATVNFSAEMLDATTFGNTTRKRQGGLTLFSLTLKGFAYVGTSCEPEMLLQPIVGSTGTAFAFFPTTINSCVACGYAGRGVVESFVPGAPVGDLIPFTATIQGQGVEV